MKLIERPDGGLREDDELAMLAHEPAVIPDLVGCIQRDGAIRCFPARESSLVWLNLDALACGFEVDDNRDSTGVFEGFLRWFRFTDGDYCRAFRVESSTHDVVLQVTSQYNHRKGGTDNE